MLPVGRPRDADQHHAAGALRIGEQRVAMVDGAGHHPRPAGAAEPLLARVRRRDVRRAATPSAASRRRRPRTVLAGRRDRHRELRAVDDRRRGEPFEMQLDVVASRQLRRGSPSASARARTRTPRCRRGSRRAVPPRSGSPLTSSVRISTRSPNRVTSSMNGRLSRLRPAYTIDQSTPRRCASAEHRQDRRDTDAARDEPEPAAPASRSRARSAGRRCADRASSPSRRPASRRAPRWTRRRRRRSGARRSGRCPVSAGSPHSEYCRTSPLGR